MTNKIGLWWIFENSVIFQDSDRPTDSYFRTISTLFCDTCLIKACLFKSFEFGNGSRMSDKNHVILEFKYLQNKKWQKQAVKSARIKTSYRTYYFHFTQLTDKNWQFSFKNWQFSTFTMFLLHSWSSMDADFHISLAYVTSGTKQFSASRTFTSQGGRGGLNRKNIKNHEILVSEPLLQEIL